MHGLLHTGIHDSLWWFNERSCLKTGALIKPILTDFEISGSLHIHIPQLFLPFWIDIKFLKWLWNFGIHAKSLQILNIYFNTLAQPKRPIKILLSLEITKINGFLLHAIIHIHYELYFFQDNICEIMLLLPQNVI